MLGVFGNLDAIGGLSAVLGAPPEMPPPDQLPASGMIEGLPEVVYRFDLRIDPRGPVSAARQGPPAAFPQFETRHTAGQLSTIRQERG